MQRYPGNTTVCHIPADSPLIGGLETIYDTFQTPSNFVRPHSPTTAEFMAQDRSRWRAGNRVRTGHVAGRDAQARSQRGHQRPRPTLRPPGPRLQQHGLAPPYRVCARSFDPATGGISLIVEGATAGEEKRMRKLRDLLADAVGFSAPNHDRYPFHVTTAYLLRYIDGDDYDQLQRDFTRLLPPLQQVEFELGAVEFCTFETMLTFRDVLLRRKGR